MFVSGCAGIRRIERYGTLCTGFMSRVCGWKMATLERGRARRQVEFRHTTLALAGTEESSGAITSVGDGDGRDDGSENRDRGIGVRDGVAPVVSIADGTGAITAQRRSRSCSGPGSW